MAQVKETAGVVARQGPPTEVAWPGWVRRVATSDWTLRLATFVVFIGVWEWYGRSTNTVTFSSASRTWDALYELTTSGKLWDAWRSDFGIMFTALSLAAVLGVTLGFLLGRFSTLDKFFEPIFNSLFMTPKVALLPIIALWMGFQFNAKVLLVVLFSFFEIFFSVRNGVKVTDAEYINVARAYMIPEGMMLRKVIAPASLPYVITGLRLGLLQGMVGLVLVGFFLENNGIGGLISRESSEFKMHTTFAAMISVMFFGVAVNSSLRFLERRIAPWKVKGAT
jgi:sulfonate transport system permease protein